MEKVNDDTSNSINYVNKHIKYCKTKNCKWCLVFKNAPLFTGTNCLISNDIETKDINAKNINVNSLASDNINVSKLEADKISVQSLQVSGKNILEVVNNKNTDYTTYRANIKYNTGVSSIEDIALSSIFWGRYPSLTQMSIVSYFNISKDPEDLVEVLYNPTFKSLDKNVGFNISIVAAKFRSLTQGWGIEYITLQKTHAYLPVEVPLTINCFWKGPLPKKYQRCYANQEIYLLFIVDNTNNNKIEYITSESQDISILI